MHHSVWMPPPTQCPVDLHGLQVLIEVASSGSIQAAAKRLSTSRATVRRRLEDLESAAGVLLLHRGTQGARLTRAGEVLAARGGQVCEDVQLALTEARHAASQATGLVRIVAPVGMQLDVAAGVIANVKAAGLGIRIALDEQADPAGDDPGQIDLMFHFGPPPHHSQWFSRVLRRAPVRLVASRAYLETHGTPQSVEDLADHALLMWTGTRHPPDLLPLRSGSSVRVVPWFTSPNISLLRRLAADGIGIALAPDGGIPDESGTGELLPVLEDVVGRDDALRVSSALPSRVDPRAAEFAARVHELLNSWPEP